MEKISKRKTYLINPKFQLSFIFFSMATTFLGMSVIFASIKYFFWSFKNMGKEYGIPENHIFFRFIEDQSSKMNFTFFISAVLVLAISLVGALLLSHRVAGPIYRMTKHLIKISEDEITDVNFREKDFFPELAEALNTFIRKVKNK
jgi:methyl-accepting chemotaxis protein